MICAAAVAIFWKVVDFLASRTVKTEDTANKKRDDQIEELKKENLARSKENIDLRHTLETLGTKIGEVRGVLEEVKKSNESGRDKQAEAHREEIKKLEINFRQEMAKQSGNDALMLVRQLETKLLGPSSERVSRDGTSRSRVKPRKG